MRILCALLLVAVYCHPAPADDREDELRRLRKRIANLEEANANSDVDLNSLESGRGRYDAVVQSYRALWIQDEFRKRKLAQSEVIMKHLLKADPSSGELQFYQGEIYRLRNGKEDRALAIDYYRHALSFRDAPPEAYRSLGLVLWDQDDTVAAGAAFEAYLENKPTADDRLMIESYPWNLFRPLG